MKKLQNYSDQFNFESISHGAFENLSDGFYVIKAEEGVPQIDSITGDIDRNFIGINVDYYLIHLNQNFRENRELVNNIRNYHQINFKQISENEYLELFNN